MPARQVFINLPVADLSAAKIFFESMGFAVDLRFTDDNAACIHFGGDAYAMLLTTSFFATFTGRTIVDAHACVEGLFALTCADRAEVDALMAAGLAAGGTEPRPATDLGFMYQRSLADLDGHVWELFFMDPAHVGA